MKRYPVNEGEWLLWVLLSHTHDTILKVRQHELKDLRISPVEAGVLFLIHDYGLPGPTPASISRWMFRESQSVTGLIERMRRKGLVKKITDKKRKGGTRIIPTFKGTEIYNKVGQTNSLLRIISCLSPAERIRLKGYLQRMRLEGLKELGQKDRMAIPSKPLR